MSVVADNPERHIGLEGCFNFRDVGGYPARNGTIVRWRRLFRSDGPHALTDNDRAALAALELATILDLRTTTEAEERGRFDAVVEATTHGLPLMDVLPDTEDFERWSAADLVALRYREMLEGGRAQIAGALEIMTDPAAYPMMFHCSAGKDRTGIFAALVLSVLGVSDETIVEDYSLSGQAMVRLVAHFQANYPAAREQLARVGPAMVSAEPETMRRFLQGVRADYGSFEGFVTDLGVGRTLPYLRASLLGG